MRNPGGDWVRDRCSGDRSYDTVKRVHLLRFENLRCQLENENGIDNQIFLLLSREGEELKALRDLEDGP